MSCSCFICITFACCLQRSWNSSCADFLSLQDQLLFSNCKCLRSNSSESGSAQEVFQRCCLRLSLNVGRSRDNESQREKPTQTQQTPAAVSAAPTGSHSSMSSRLDEERRRSDHQSLTSLSSGLHVKSLSPTLTQCSA